MTALCLAGIPHTGDAQRVVSSKHWVPSATDGSSWIKLRPGASISPRLAALAPRGELIERVVAFRADSLLLGLRTSDSSGTYNVSDSITVPAVAVEWVRVWRKSMRQARLSTGGETAFYTGLLGALVGFVAGGRDHRVQGTALGTGSAALFGFVWGAAHPYEGYATYWDEITLRVDRKR